MITLSTALPTASLLIIGAEVLSGKVADANGPYLIGALRERGVELVQIHTIGDSVAQIAAAVRTMTGASDVVFTTGGIGPTHDDVTIAGVAEGFGRTVVEHPSLLQTLQERYGVKLNAARRKMAEVPAGAEVIFGDGTFVPVVRLNNVYVLPGVPSLMRSCFVGIAAKLRGPPFYSRALLLKVGESEIAALLTTVQAQRPQVSIGSYPHFEAANYRVKITVDGRDVAQVESCLVALRRGLPSGAIVGELP